MKKLRTYGVVIVAALLAITMVFGFTDINKSTPTDPCQQSQMKWFIFQQECDDTPATLSELLDKNNYVEGTQTGVNELCTGYECMCAVYACPIYSNGAWRPNLDPNSWAYYNIYWWYWVGYHGGTTAFKDQYWGVK